MVAAKLYMSVFNVSSLPIACSGEQYSGVIPLALASPKSVILAVPSFVKRIFCGLISLCIILFL